MKSEPWRFLNEQAPQLDPVFAELFAGLEDRDWRLGLQRVTAPALIFHGLADGPAAIAMAVQGAGTSLDKRQEHHRWWIGSEGLSISFESHRMLGKGGG